MAVGKIVQEIALKISGLDDVKKLDRQIEDLEKKKAEVKVTADTTEADRRLDEIDREIAALEHQKATVNVDADTTGADHKLDTINREIDALKHERARVEVDADTSDADRKIKEIDRQLDALKHQKTKVDIDADSTPATGAFEKLKTVGGNALNFLKDNAASFAAGGFTAIAAGAAKAVGDFQDLALTAGELRDALGLSAEEASRWVEVAGDIGIESGAIESTFGKLLNTIGKSPKAFSDLGIELAHTADGAVDVNETILNVIDHLNKIEDPTKRAAEAQKLLGKSWKDSAELITAGADDVRQRLAEVGDAKVMTDAQIDQAREFRNNMDDLGDKAEEFAVSVGGLLVPALSSAASTVVDLLGPLKDLKTAFEDVGDVKIDVPGMGGFKVSDIMDVPGIKEMLNPLGAAKDKTQEWFDLFNDGKIQASVGDLGQQTAILGDEVTDTGKAFEKTDPLVEAVQQAYKDGAAAAEDMAKAQAELEKSLRDTNESLDAAALASDGFTSALDKIDAASELDFSLMAIDTVKSFDNIKGALEDAQKAGVDWSKVDLTPESVGELKGITPQLQAVTVAVHGMRESIQTELKAAFDTGGIQAYRDKAAFFADEIGGQFVQSFKDAGASTAEAEAKTRELLEALGLLPEQVEIQIKLSQAESARKTLEIFKSDIDNLPPLVSTEIKTLWAKGSTVEALQLLNKYMTDHGLPPIPIDSIINPPGSPPMPDIPPVEISALYATEADGLATMIDSAQQAVDGNPLNILVNADAKPATGEVHNWIEDTNDSKATATLDANGLPAVLVVGGWKTKADGTTGKATLDANGLPADLIVGGWRTKANSTTGKAQFDANGLPADLVVGGWKTKADGTKGTANFTASASTSQADRDLDNTANPGGKPRTARIVVAVTNSGGFKTANGTNSMPEPGGIAGEAGGEFVQLPNGQWGYVNRATYMPPKTKVISVRRTRSILAGRSRGPSGPGLPSYASGTGTAVLVPSTTVINHHVSVNAAVVGSRYDVARAVGQGNRDLVRLLGRRGTAGA